MRKYKLYEYRNQHTKEMIWWTQRDENGNCFEIRKELCKNIFRLYKNEIFKAAFNSLIEVERTIKDEWNRVV